MNAKTIILSVLVLALSVFGGIAGYQLHHASDGGGSPQPSTPSTSEPHTKTKTVEPPPEPTHTHTQPVPRPVYNSTNDCVSYPSGWTRNPGDMGYIAVMTCPGSDVQASWVDPNDGCAMYPEGWAGPGDDPNSKYTADYPVCHGSPATP